MFNLALFLTLFRLVSSLIFPIVLVHFFQVGSSINFLLSLLFLLIALTDLADGHIARAKNQTTELGKILDPIADKFLLFCTLIPLVYLQIFHYYLALVLMARELFVMALREIALSKSKQIAVINSAKMKTTLQTILLSFYIAYPHTILGQYFFPLKFVLVSSTLFLSLYSAACYFVIFRKNLKIGF